MKDNSFIKVQLHILLRKYNVLSKFYEYRKKSGKLLLRDNDIGPHTISVSFTWSKTDEGHDFWRSIDYQWMNIYTYKMWNIPKLDENIIAL